MLNVEQTKILEEAIFLLLKLRNEQSIDNWETARARELKTPLPRRFDNANETKKTPPFDSNVVKNGYRLLKFTEKEILKMPKRLRIVIRELNCAVYARKRTTGRYKCSYEIRFSRNGYKISASGRTKEEAKKRFIEKSLIFEAQQDCPALAIPKHFDGFALYWFENFHKAKVMDKTYKNNFSLYERHIKKPLEKFKVVDITPATLKQLLSSLPGNGKTEDDVHSILNQIFETAITHGLIKVNPIKLIPHLQHDRETGIELTRNEETMLLNNYADTVYEIIFSVMLFTGLRINEYKTAHIDGNFIVALNSKQKNGKVEYKKIPICTHLRERLSGLTELPKRHEATIRYNYKKLFPNHTLKDLRKTFNTRCIECKVDTFARKKFMGHSVGKLDKTYTGSLDDYLLEESKKLNIWYTLYPNNTPNTDN